MDPTNPAHIFLVNLWFLGRRTLTPNAEAVINPATQGLT